MDDGAGIVVLGGGFAGLYAALAAARVSSGRLPIRLVSRDPYLTIRPRLYEGDVERLRVPLGPTLEKVGVELVAAPVSRLRAQAHEIETASGAVLSYKRLVLATGSALAIPPGLAEAYAVDDYCTARRFDDHLQRVAAKPGLRVVVVGAGFTGLELATALRSRIAGHAGPDAAAAADIVLLDRGSGVPRGYPDVSADAIGEALRRERITLRQEVEIEGLEHGSLRLAGGERLRADAVVLCTGQRASPLAAGLGGARDPFGRLVVAADLRAPETRDVFLAGDVACAPAARGRATYMSCQHAIALGKVAGENAARDLLELPLIDYAQPNYVTCLDLGDHDALLTAGWDREPLLRGEPAKRVKRLINERAIYPPRGEADALLRASLPGPGVTGLDLAHAAGVALADDVA